MRSLTKTFNILRSFSTQPLHKTIERPFTPQIWTAMSAFHIQTIPHPSSLEAILHSNSLMYNQITSFNYDFYQWSCYRLLENQQELTKEEILMMLRLGKIYKVKVQPFYQYIENQLYLRVHRDYQYQMQEYDEKIRREMQNIIAQLEQKSQDYFKIMNEQSQDQPKQEGGSGETAKIEQTEDEKLITNMSKKLSKKSRKSKEILMSDILEIVELMKTNGSKNIAFLQYILELITFKYENSKQINTKEMLDYVKLITYLCQNLMQQYQENKKKYTPRSIKRIFKFQLLYFHQHLRQLQLVKSSMTGKELEELVINYSAFPIKRRQVRKNIALTLSQEIKKKGMEKDLDFVKGFVGINGKDEKMKKIYCELIGIQAEQAKTLGLYIEKEKLIESKEGQGQVQGQQKGAQREQKEQEDSQEQEDIHSQQNAQIKQ